MIAIVTVIIIALVTVILGPGIKFDGGIRNGEGREEVLTNTMIVIQMMVVLVTAANIEYGEEDQVRDGVGVGEGKADIHLIQTKIRLKKLLL